MGRAHELTDVVYLVGENRDHEQLRWSLRSLRHLGHGRVWIVGHRPPWIRNIVHVPTVQAGTAFANTTAGVLAACLHPDMPERFALFNDDFYAVAPTTVPTWHRGPVATQRSYRPRRGVAAHREGMQATVWLLDQWGHPDPLDYDIHVPLPVHRRTMRTVLDAAAPARVAALHKRTLYGNVARIGGTRHPDVKVADRRTTWPDDACWVSTTADSFARGEVGRRLRALFLSLIHI